MAVQRLSDRLWDHQAAGLLKMVLTPDAVPLDFPTDRVAHQYAKDLLDVLSILYHVPEWTPLLYEELILRRMVMAWRPGSRVETISDGFRVTMPGCPLEDDVRREPGLCNLCQQLQAGMAEEVFRKSFQQGRFEELVVKGAPACVLRLVVQPQRAASPNSITAPDRHD